MYCLDPKIHVSIFLKMVSCSDNTTLRHLSGPYGKEITAVKYTGSRILKLLLLSMLRFCSAVLTSVGHSHWNNRG